MNTPTVLAVVGPTASGKSGVALEVARARTCSGRPTEIVAVDAFTVYRGMDLGTAKPPPSDREAVRHHMIDVCDPSDELTVAQFQARARAVIAELRRDGVTPLLVGGSGLYWRAVVDDLRFPPTDPAVRTRLEHRWSSDPVEAHAALARIDPEAAERIDPANLRRTVRALEVIELTGESFSSYRRAWQHYDSVIGDLEVALLDPPDSVLRSTIATRSEAMVDTGLLSEAEQLRSAGPLSRTAEQAIGYAEAFAVLDGELATDELAGAIARRTWRYARRQRSWFRADPRCRPPSIIDGWR